MLLGIFSFSSSLPVSICVCVYIKIGTFFLILAEFNVANPDRLFQVFVYENLIAWGQ